MSALVIIHGWPGVVAEFYEMLEKGSRSNLTRQRDSQRPHIPNRAQCAGFRSLRYGGHHGAGDVHANGPPAPRNPPLGPVLGKANRHGGQGCRSASSGDLLWLGADAYAGRCSTPDL